MFVLLAQMTSLPALITKPGSSSAERAGAGAREQWGGGGRRFAGDAAIFRRTYSAEHLGRLHFCEWCSLPAGAHRWCPQRYMGRAKRALIKGFDQKKTHHLPSSPPFCTQWIRGRKRCRPGFLQKSEICCEQPWKKKREE